jgi:SPP1 family predicted phage head-tail adaptor
MIRHLLNAGVDVYRATFTDDGRGGRTSTLAKVGTVRARVAQPSAAERAVAAQLGAVLEHVVHVEHVADVERGDELDTGGPRRLRVQSVVIDSSSTYKRLECQVIEGAGV